ncbi:Imm50 family immunity protein [Micromonospora zamorensis]|uniref:Imm50 family immunity protein n=1 Tax=Micromonospora zamorensis TaxID=709883 RepID=UPI00379554CD
MSWVDLVTNPQGLREIFPEGPPSLSGVSLYGLVVEREGPTLRLRLDLPAYPADPPARWLRAGFNTVQVELLFGGVSELRLVGISTEVIADLEIRAARGVSLEVRSAPMVVSALAASVTVSEVVAYVDGGREADR